MISISQTLGSFFLFPNEPLLKKYLAFLRDANAGSDNFYLWLLTGPFNGKVQPPSAPTQGVARVFRR